MIWATPIEAQDGRAVVRSLVVVYIPPLAATRPLPFYIVQHTAVVNKVPGTRYEVTSTRYIRSKGRRIETSTKHVQ